jgi:hypothetical protein
MVALFLVLLVTTGAIYPVTSGAPVVITVALHARLVV